MRVQRLTESKTSTIELTEEQAVVLQQLGRGLTSSTEGSEWWGSPDEGQDQERKSKTLIDVHRAETPGSWRVKVKNAVGLVSVGDLQLEVEPKIPLEHLMYLFERAGAIPESEETLAQAESGDAFWKLIARWYIAELETLLRRDLVRGYEHHQERLKTVKGRIRPTQVTDSYYRGSLDFDCEYEEFKADTPLNRTLRAAARKTSSIETLDRSIRKRGAAGTRRMEHIGELRSGDVHAEPTRSTAHYRNAILLARHLLGGVGRLPTTGPSYARTFLIPTPIPVQKGILNILKGRLGDKWDIRPRRLPLAPSSVTVNPDLVFEHGYAVGDVKYKIFSKEWSRPDLYQSVAFAEAFGTKASCVIGFSVEENPPTPPPVTVGRIVVEAIAWDASGSGKPDDSAMRMVSRIEEWLAQVEGRS